MPACLDVGILSIQAKTQSARCEVDVASLFASCRAAAPNASAAALRELPSSAASSSPSGALSPVLSSKFYTPAFELCGTQWRLLFAPGDFNEEAISVYLEHTPSARGERQECRCTFSLRVAGGAAHTTTSAGAPAGPVVATESDQVGPGSRLVQGARSKAERAAAQALAPSGARNGKQKSESERPDPSDLREDVDALAPLPSQQQLQHTFSPHDPTWGFQDLLSLREIAALEAAHRPLVVTLQLDACRVIPWNKIPIAPSVVLQETPYRIELISEHPRVLLFEDFVDGGLCDRLVRLASPDIQRSRVSSGSETPSRTSSGTFLTGRREAEPPVVEFEARIAELLRNPVVRRGGRKPLYEVEAVQVVRYNESEQYQAHYDSRAGHVHLRAATFMTYLSDVDAGGATYFPRSKGLAPGSNAGSIACLQSPPVDPAAAASFARFTAGGAATSDAAGLNMNIAIGGGGAIAARAGGHASSGLRNLLLPGAGSSSSAVPMSRKPEDCVVTINKDEGLRVFPKKGRAVMFWSRLPDGTEDVASIHAGEEVLSGTKWIATRWLREDDTGMMLEPRTPKA